MHAVPGGPFDGHDMPLSEAVRAKLMARLGLDQPLWVQYLNYMWGVLHFDFGVPFQSPGRNGAEPACQRLAAEPDPRRPGRPHRCAARHSARHGGRAAPQYLDRLPRLGRGDARADRAGLRHLDAAHPGLCRLAPLAAGERLGQAGALDPADRRLCGGAARDLCALYPLGDARHAQPPVRHGACAPRD